MEHQNWNETILGGKSKLKITVFLYYSEKKKGKKAMNKAFQQGKGMKQKPKSTHPYNISENLNLLVGNAGKKMHAILEDDDTYQGILHFLKELIIQQV